MFNTVLPGQRQQILIQSYGIPISQNTNQLFLNNQFQYQGQIILQPNHTQNFQPVQNIYNLQNNQLLNSQKIQQLQNMQKKQQIQKLQEQNIKNNQNKQNLENLNLHNGEKQLVSKNGHKNQNQNQLQKTAVKLKSKSNQNLIKINNLNPDFIQKEKNKSKEIIGESIMKSSQAIGLETSKKNQMDKSKEQPIKDSVLNLPKKRDSAPVQKLMENLRNTAFLPNPENEQTQKTDLYNTQPVQKKSATLMTVNSLANLPYNEYPEVKFSSKPFFNISGYGSNSYNGKIKNFNEDMVKTLVNVEKKVVINNQIISPNISYFGIFDGHGGDKCSKFLKNNLDKFLFNSKYFPSNIKESIRDAFDKIEKQFSLHAIKNGKLVDKSGSCALIALIIDRIFYSINLGDSRALFSRNSGKELYQVTRDHKPNDEKEKARIENYGGKVYYANKTTVNGVEIILKEEQFGKGFTFPHRLSPSGLAVSIFL